MDRPVIFLSYSHHDEEEKRQLVAHLNVLRHDGVDLWLDDHLAGGDDWEREVMERVEGASIAVLLVSENYLNSQFILESELPALQRRRDGGRLTIFPIIAKPCAWRQVPWLRAMNVRPKNGVPVWDGDEAEAGKRLAALADEIAGLARCSPSADVRSSVAVGGTSLTIRYDPDLYRRQFLESLRRFTDDLWSERSESLFGRDALRRWRRQEEAVRGRLETDFTLVVVGSFKRGKSTLINALLGEEVVTSDVAPETVTINEIRYGPRHTVEACLRDGGRVTLAPEQLRHDQLAPILAGLPQEVVSLDVRAPVEWLRGLCLVDTPGTGDLLQRFDRQVQEYLTRADAVLFVLSPLSPLSETERSFLHLAVLPQDFAKITFVVNMLDKVRTERDVRRITKLLREKVEKMFPDALLFGVSAHDELARLRGEARPKPGRGLSLAASFESFRAHVRESILHNRDLIRLDRAVAEAGRLLGGVEAHVQRLRQALGTDQARLEDAIGLCVDESSDLHSRMRQGHERLQETVETLGRHARGWMESFLDRLENAARGLGLFDFKDLQRHFPFFLADALRTAIHRCLEAHRPVILEAVEQSQHDLSHDLGSLVNVAQTEAAVERSASEATFGDALWDRLDTSEVLLEITQTQVFGIVAELVKQLGQPGRERQQSLLYQQRFLSSFPHLRRSLLQEAEAVYRGMAQHLVNDLRGRQQQDLEASLAALRQAQDLTGQGRQGAPAGDLERALSWIAATRAELADLQRRLWPEATETVEDGIARIGI